MIITIMIIYKSDVILETFWLVDLFVSISGLETSRKQKEKQIFIVSPEFIDVDCKIIIYHTNEYK